MKLSLLSLLFFAIVAIQAQAADTSKTSQLDMLESTAGSKSPLSHVENIESISLRGSSSEATERETQFMSLSFLVPAFFMLIYSSVAGILAFIQLEEHEDDRRKFI